MKRSQEEHKNKIHKGKTCRRGILFYLLLSVLLLTGCEKASEVNIGFLAGGGTSQEAAEEKTIEDTGFRIMQPGEYDSKDTAVVVKVLEEEKQITFLNRIVNKNYTLTYDGTTVITDKHGNGMSAAQLVPGDVVDVKFQHIPKKCVAVSAAQDGWEQEVLFGFELNQARGQISFNGDMYTLSERMVMLSQGEEIELTDLNELDVLRVTGIGNVVCGIIVEKGHGYLRLIGEEYFVDGFVEVGQKMVQRITEDMLLTVPEGEYDIVVRNGDHGGSKKAVIYRDEETVLDVSDLKGEDVKIGNVFFTLTPGDAQVYIDGEKVDTSVYVPLEYGIHQMIVKAEGYETISQYLKVGQQNANLNVELEPVGTQTSEKEEEENTDTDQSNPAGEVQPETTQPSQATEGQTNTAQPGQATEGQTNMAQPGQATEGQTNTVQPGQQQETATGEGTWRVKVNAPASVEVYVDGNYVGLAPVSFPKKAGSHVISLRKTGYQTRSYTIQVDAEKKDMELSFSELVKKSDTLMGAGTGLNALSSGSLNSADALGVGVDQWTNNILSQTLSGL